MGEKNYTFNSYNKFASSGIKESLNINNEKRKMPVIICVGSDSVVGDSLGPLIGTFLKNKNTNAYVYGTLSNPITAKEIEYVKKYICLLHPESCIIVIDAAVGESEDVGLIRVLNHGIKPGLGVCKNLSEIGDVSIIGVVAAKSSGNYNLFNLTRLSFIYKMAEVITEGVAGYLNNFSTNIYALNKNGA